MKMAEAQHAHRIRQENRVIGGNVRAQTMGAIFGFILGLIGLGGGFFLLYTGHDITGFVLMITAMASLASVFVVGKTKQSRELAKKRSLEE